MKNCYSWSICLIFVFLLFGNQCIQGQNIIKYEESSALAKKSKDIVPDKKALFIFEATATDTYQFESDNEIIEQPKKEGLLYKLLIDISTPSGGITIKQKGADDAFIHYGVSTAQNALPPLKNKEIKYFKLSVIARLDCIDITEKIKSKGILDTQALLPEAGLIIFNVSQKDVALTFEGNDILKTVPEEGKYKVYVKPKVPNILIKAKNSEDVLLEFKSDTVFSRNVRYYRIQSSMNSDFNKIDPLGVVGNYTIESSPSGALIKMIGNPDFDSKNYTTPRTFPGLGVGKKIITLSLDRYESRSDTIEITSTTSGKTMIKLIPKFGFINCNIEPSIPISKVLLDGKELLDIKNGVDYECPKGIHTVLITAPHYYPESTQINLGAGLTRLFTNKLTSKKGWLSIPNDGNAKGAEVMLNNKKIGDIPISKIELQEGNYTLTFKKSGLVSEKLTYSVEISENKETLFNDLKMVNIKKVHITTVPVRGATVYVDNVLLDEKSNLYATLGVGEHSIKIVRDHYKTVEKQFTITQESEEFNFLIEELSYQVSFSTNPEQSNVSVNGKFIGNTPMNTSLPLGSYVIDFQKNKYFDKKKHINVSKPMTLSTRLFPNELIVLGAEYGADQYRFNAGLLSGRVLLTAGIQINANTNKVSENNLAISNVTVYDINTYGKEYGKIYVKDSAFLSFSGKIGYTFKKPFVFIITGGCAFIRTDKFQPVYKANHEYLAQTSGKVINRGDLFSTPQMTSNTYTALTAGILLPIARRMYLSVDYYSDSDIGPGFTFGLGILLPH